MSSAVMVYKKEKRKTFLKRAARLNESSVTYVQGYECGEASQCGNASLHGAGGDVLEHPHVPMAENL